MDLNLQAVLYVRVVELRWGETKLVASSVLTLSMKRAQAPVVAQVVVPSGAKLNLLMKEVGDFLSYSIQYLLTSSFQAVT